MIKKIFIISLTIFIVVLLSSCASIKKNTEKEDLVLKKVQNEIDVFQGNLSSAYFILGYECYQLADEYKNKGDKEKAKFFLEKAKLYNGMYEELKITSKITTEKTDK